MKNTKYGKLIIFIFLVLFFWGNKAEAAQIILSPAKTTFGLHEQFYVDFLLSPDEDSINGLEGSVVFPMDKVSFIRTEMVDSIVSLWIEEPSQAQYNKINFAGIIKNGFSGIIDPFNSTKKIPGRVFRIIFEAIAPGQFNIETSPVILTVNDGLGTVQNEPKSSIALNVQNVENKTTHESMRSSGRQTIKLEAEAVKIPELFNNQYVLIFRAEDKTNGIKRVLVREGDREWKEAKSPYLLEDQSRSSLISINATNLVGESISTSIEPLKPNWTQRISFISIMILIAVILLLFFWAKYGPKKDEKIN